MRLRLRKIAKLYSGEPDVVNNISEVFEHKLAALGAHRSQTEAMLEETHAKIKTKMQQH